MERKERKGKGGIDHSGAECFLIDTFKISMCHFMNIILSRTFKHRMFSKSFVKPLVDKSLNEISRKILDL